jgi:serine/threonine protein kinase
MELLGSGTYGEVYLVTKDNGKKMVMKISTKDKIPYLQREAAFYLLLQKGPGILRMKSLLIKKDKASLYMSYGGCALCEMKYQPETKQSITKQLLQSLAWIHSKNIIHADLKPANILFNSETKTVSIIDFGISFFMTEQTYMPIQTEGYRAPEVEKVKTEMSFFTTQVDIWSLGVIVAELFLGWHVVAQLRKEGTDKYPENLRQRVYEYRKWFGNLYHLVRIMLLEDPTKRLSAAQLLNLFFPEDQPNKV